MFGIFKPAAHRERIKDPAVVKSKFRYWQFRTLGGMYFGYMLFYFTRNNLAAALPGLLHHLGCSKTDIGWVFTLWSLMYGLSKFTSGIVSDRSNPRFFMAFGLIITGFINIVFGFNTSILMFAVLWGINGWFQGWGWPPCSRLLMHWYPQKQRARWWAVWNTSHNVGGAIIPPLAAVFIVWFGGWQYALWLPGIMAIGGGFVLMFTLRDTPQSLGLPSVEEFSGEKIGEEEESNERELTTREILFKYVLSNRFIWMLCGAYFLVYVVRQSINMWSVVYLTEVHGYTLGAAAMGLFVFEAGGIFGSLVAGWLSDLGFKGRRAPANAIFSLGIAGSVLLFWVFAGSHWIFAMGSMFMLGFFIFGPQMLIGIAAAELSHKKASATATGFAGFFAYVGAASAGAPIAYVMEAWGWRAFFLTVVGCASVVVFMVLPMWSVSHRDEEEEETTEAEVA